jgi:anti-sigma factor RsiW
VLFRRRRTLVCRQAVDLMSDYLDGSLSNRDGVRLEAHLSGCPHCGEYLEQLRATLDALGQATPEDLPDHAVDEFVVLYRRWRAG